MRTPDARLYQALLGDPDTADVKRAKAELRRQHLARRNQGINPAP
jgi:hypothetical protein